MRKKIAIFLGEITGTFQEKIIRAITKKANALGYDIISFCTYGSYNDDVLFADGEKACTYIPNYQDFDGVIVTEDVFDIDGMADEVYTNLMEKTKCPIVYLRTERAGCYSVLSENKEPIKNMTRHFLEEHGFRDIVYMSGKKGLMDAKERLKGFLEAMDEKGIPVTEHMVFHGDYWREKGKVAIDWFMEGRTTYPQAIICANDYMALSICEELRARGVKVPEEVCVSGFDYVEEARLYQPSITSIHVDFSKMAEMAVDMIDNVNMGRPQERIEWITPELKLQKSCGCGEQWTLTDVAGMLDRNYEQIYTMKNIMLSTMEYQDSFEEYEYLAVAEKYFSIFRCDKVWLCLCDSGEEGYFSVENENSFTKQMILKRIFYRNNVAEKLEVKFPREQIIPNNQWNQDGPTNLLVFSLHFKNKVYGYFVAELPENIWCDIYTQAYMLNLANAMENAAVQTELTSFAEIKALYQRDSLTGLYNRRGMDKLGREMYLKSKADGTPFTVVSIDMDGLKFINDHYGHTEGDRALKRLADALQSVLMEGEIAARVGGDEFSVILCHPIQDREQIFEVQLQLAIDNSNQMYSMFPIGASVGMCKMEESPRSPLIGIIQIADMRMYQNKRARKNNQKQES